MNWYSELPVNSRMGYHTYKDILKKDPCVYCGHLDDDMTADHIIPRCMGGNNTWINVASSCQRCNTSKGPYTLLDFLLHRTNKRHMGHPSKQWNMPSKREKYEMANTLCLLSENLEENLTLPLWLNLHNRQGND